MKNKNFHEVQLSSHETSWGSCSGVYEAGEPTDEQWDKINDDSDISLSPFDPYATMHVTISRFD